MDTASWCDHGQLSDPGSLAYLFDDLPRDVGALCAVVQGLLLHDHWGGVLYGPPPRGFDGASRRTLPVAERLAAVLARDPMPLSVARLPERREIGTCRDFALLLVSLLRYQGTPAGVRYGFADYFAGPWEDHWVAEYRRGGDWAFADPQLDAEHRAHLGLGFDPADMPRARFLTAPDAWRACRSGAEPDAFGHGEARGLWFVEVNLMRDRLALGRAETSGWDDWRGARAEHRVIDGARLERGDRIAGGSDMVPEPPWAAGA